MDATFLVVAPHQLTMLWLGLAYDPLPLSAEVWAPLVSFELSRWRDGRCCMGVPLALMAV